jgi:hypothetical protein
MMRAHLAELAAHELLHDASRLGVRLLRPRQLYLQLVYAKKHLPPVPRFSCRPHLLPKLEFV